MQELMDALDGWRAEGAGVGRAVVVRTFGSAPRPEGAVLLVTDDGRLAGSVSGGCVEGAAAEEILAARKAGRERVIRYGISDEQAWDVGLACGGTIDVLISPSVPGFRRRGCPRDSRRPGRRARDRDGAAGRFATGGLWRARAGAGERARRAAGRSTTTAGWKARWAIPRSMRRWSRRGRPRWRRACRGRVEIGGRQLFIEAYPVRPRLVVVGAVEVSRTLVRLAKELGYETVVIDGRAAFATEARFPDVDRLIVGWPDEVADEIGLGPADAVAVLTHDVKFDEPAIIAALARGCRYVGAVGSRKTQADRRARLLEAGVAPADLDRLRGPIGLDLGGRLPAETALAILAEVVSERRAGTGRPMRELARAREAAGAAGGGPDAAAGGDPAAAG